MLLNTVTKLFKKFYKVSNKMLLCPPWACKHECQIMTPLINAFNATLWKLSQVPFSSYRLLKLFGCTKFSVIVNTLMKNCPNNIIKCHDKIISIHLASICGETDVLLTACLAICFDFNAVICVSACEKELVREIHHWASCLKLCTTFRTILWRR